MVMGMATRRGESELAFARRLLPRWGVRRCRLMGRPICKGSVVDGYVATWRGFDIVQAHAERVEVLVELCWRLRTYGDLRRRRRK